MNGRLSRLMAAWLGASALSLCACGGDGVSDANPGATTMFATGGVGDGTTSITAGESTATGFAATAGAGGTAAGGAASTTGFVPVTTGFTPVTTAGPVAAADAGPADTTGGSAGSTGAAPQTPFTGPVDGDPNKPMVEIEGIPCGAPRLGFGSTPPSVQVTNRDVVVTYPCAHEGAAVTFFLFLHGTLQDAQKVFFTMNAFPIHEYTDTDNVIVVVPKAIGTQWGREDNGEDLPHLYEVVDWVYDTFGDKFDIRSMWASGGSWGSFYLNSTFACDPKFENRLRGVRMIVGSPCPRCSDRLACIVGEQELEEGMGMPLSEAAQEMRSSSNIDMFASAHGCGPKMKMPDLGTVRHWTWPDCDPGFAYSYYLGPGEHADPWNDPVSMPHMVAEIKSIE